MAVTRIKNNQITDSTIVANAKIQNYTVTSTLLANNLTYGSDLTVTGNLTVQGQTTTIDTNVTTIEDPVILLASTQTGSPTVDIGFIGERGTSDNIAFVWDESADEFVTAFTSTSETNTTITISSYANFHTNDANVGGNITVAGTTGLTGAITLTGNTSAGNFSVNSSKTVTFGDNVLGNVGTPLLNTDAATKGYVDGEIGSIDFDITDGVNTETVAPGDTITFSGTANEVTVVVSATDTVTFGLPDNVVVTGSITGNSISSNTTISATGNVTGGNLITTGLASVTGNITGGNINTGGQVVATGNITGGNISTGGQINSTGNINGSGAVFSGNVTAQNFIGNISGNIDAGGANTNIQFNDGDILNGSAAFTFNKTSNAVTASGNITGGNLLTGGIVNATGNVTGGNLVTSGVADVTGNVTGGNLVTSGLTTTSTLAVSSTSTFTGNVTSAFNVTGNITGGNLITAGTVESASITSTGNITGGNLLTGGLVNATGNVTGGNLNTAGQVVATGNITGGNLITAGTFESASITSTGNITGGNLLTGGLVNATGNVTGGNLITAGLASVTGNITGGNISTGGVIDSTGTITGGNISTAGTVTATGNVTGGNVITGGIVTATGNVTGGNLITVGLTNTGTLQVAGNAIVDGNLVVNGNISYINIDDLRVQDPIIVLGTGPNGAPLTTNDGLDRGVFMEYYTTGLGNAFMGWDNSTGNMVIAASAYFTANDVVGVNSYGTLEAGNLYVQSVGSTGNVTGGNLNTAGQVVATGNITGGNLITAGTFESASISATGNITGGNINTGGKVVATGNVETGANVVATGYAAITGNVTGGNLNTAGLASVDGNITGGNLNTAGQVVATGNITGGNISAGSGIITTTGNINGGNLNVTSRVAAATGYFTGNVDVLGNLNATIGVVYANSGIFLGDAVTGNNAAFAGIPGYTQLGSNVVMQFAGNVNAYSQLNFQNINAGNQASTDYIATADNGSDTTYYVDLGINSSTFNDPVNYPGFGPNDSYVHNHGGNLILNPETAGKAINFMVGGTANANVIGYVNASGLSVTGTISATGNTSGGNLTTAGQVTATGNIAGGNISAGSGIIATTGNINGANINATANVTGTGAVFTGNVTAANFIGNISGNIDAGGANTNIQFNDGDILNGSAAFTFDKNSNAVVASGNVTGGNLLTGGLVSATGNVTGGNLVTAGLASVTGNVTGGNLVTAGIADVTGNVTGGNLNTAGQVVATGNVNGANVVATALVTGANVTASANVTGANVVGTTSVTGGNIVITGDDITDTNGRVNFNTAGADVDFAVNGDTVANVFYVDAGTGTVSFGSATQTTGALAAFNTTSSVLMPVGNIGTRPGTGVTGMMRFNTTNNNLEVYDNSQWSAVGVPSFTVITNDSFAGDGSTVAFTLSESASTDSCIVSINGVVQIPTTAYSVSGTTLTFTEAPLTGDAIDVRILTTTTSVTSISNSAGNAVVATLDTANTVQITGELLPAGNLTQSLGSPTKYWKSLYVGGNTIYLGNLQLKAENGTMAFYESDGTTPAPISSGSVDTSLISSGTSSVAVIAAGGNVRTNIAGATVQTISSTGVAITGDLSVTGNATLSGNILGDRIQNGTTQIDIQTQNGNANITVAGTANVAVFSSGGANITGTLGVTGNITGGNLSGTSIVGTLTTASQTNITSVGTLGSLAVTGNITSGNVSGTRGVFTNIAGTLETAAQTNITSVGTLSSLTVTANVTGGNLITGGLISATGAITGGALTGTSLTVGTGTITGGNIVNSNANGIGNIGSSTTYFNTVFAKATSAQYADLAEKYVADAEYPAGTVVVFGGDKEVTVTSVDADRAVAGVVSTNPSYIMNGGLEAEFVATVALTGRVPCRVTGTVKKGDLMVSAGYGLARAEQDPRVGTVIGKALENFEGNEGVIEVVVGRF